MRTSSSTRRPFLLFGFLTACIGSVPAGSQGTDTDGGTGTKGTTTSSSGVGSTSGSTTAPTTTDGTSVGTTGTTGTPCEPGRIPCGDVCVDPQTDPMHCGGCGIPCDTYEVCSSGTCTPDENVVQVSNGYAHVCVRTTTGRVRCWGANQSGELGLGHLNPIGDDEFPGGSLDVDLPAPALQVATGDTFSCALVADGSVLCWGGNDSFQLGFGAPSELSAPDPAKPVIGVDDAVAVAASAGRACALSAGGTVRCWGKNDFGQLGYGHTSQTTAQGDVDVGFSVVQLALGWIHTCALGAEGQVLCWGRNNLGQLGHGDGMATDIGDDELPSSGTLVDLGSTATAICAGGDFTCARLTGDTSIRCWGFNGDGRLGLGHTNDVGVTDVPKDAGAVQLSPNVGAETIIDLDCGQASACVVFEDGAIQCWGDNVYGQLGLGHKASIGDDEPVGDGGLLAAPASAEVSGGQYFRCLLTTDATVRCWGRNDAGQLGYGNTTSPIGDTSDETPDKLMDVPIFP